MIAGEESGDLHGGALVRHLRSLNPQIEIAGLGGQRMADAGMEQIHDLPSDLAVMGFIPVLTRLPRIGWILDRLYDELERRPPDLLILIDFPGFNLHVARFARNHGIPVLYYIVPQLWAWGHWRLPRVRRLIDRMLVIFPFEESFYRDRGIDARFVGHPLFDHLESITRAPQESTSTVPTVGLLPGSRSQEIRSLLPTMLKTARILRQEIPELTFDLPVARPRHLPLVESILRTHAYDIDVRIALEGAHQVMQNSSLCLVASGTATLETAFFGTPLITLYRVGFLARQVARFLLRTSHFGIVNILAGREIVPEILLVREDPERVAKTALPLLIDSTRRERMLSDLRAVRDSVFLPQASQRAASEALSFLGELTSE